MSKKPFTQQGIDDLTAELYAFPDPQLQSEADYIRDHFSGFILQSFDLSGPQEAYFNAMNTQWILETGNIISVAVRHRLPVLLDPGTPLPPASSKYVRTKNKLVINQNPDGTVSTTGLVSIEIEYS